jgi:hypothetical protein
MPGLYIVLFGRERRRVDNVYYGAIIMLWGARIATVNNRDG